VAAARIRIGRHHSTFWRSFRIGSLSEQISRGREVLEPAAKAAHSVW